MIVGVMELHLALYDNDSLKAKRSVVKRVIHRCRNQFNVSASEVDEQDCTDRAVIGVASAGSDKRYIEGQLQRLEDFVVRMALADVVESPRTYETF